MTLMKPIQNSSKVHKIHTESDLLAKLYLSEPYFMSREHVSMDPRAIFVWLRDSYTRLVSHFVHTFIY